MYRLFLCRASDLVECQNAFASAAHETCDVALLEQAGLLASHACLLYFTRLRYVLAMQTSVPTEFVPAVAAATYMALACPVAVEVSDTRARTRNTVLQVFDLGDVHSVSLTTFSTGIYYNFVAKQYITGLV